MNDSCDVQVCYYSSYVYKCLSYSSRGDRVTFRKLFHNGNQMHPKVGCGEMWAIDNFKLNGVASLLAVIFIVMAVRT